jgi:hypothetical protein
MKYEKRSEIFKISGDWEALAKKLKEKYPELTDIDLNFSEG